MAWVMDNNRPIYVQIVEKVQMEILSGKYQRGEKLPSVRDLASEAGVNPNTMQRAFAELEAKNLVCTQRTAGRTITQDIALINNLRKEQAVSEIKIFFAKMQNLGLSVSECNNLIKALYEEENNE